MFRRFRNRKKVKIKSKKRNRTGFRIGEEPINTMVNKARTRQQNQTEHFEHSEGNVQQWVGLFCQLNSLFLVSGLEKTRRF
jgi:hypothetical protein